MFGLATRRQQGPAGARGWRAYVVGDVHGRLDLLDQLLEKIHGELRRKPTRKALLVFVGDLIDRGPGSAQVVERLRTYQHPRVTPMFLLGNHEEVLLRILRGEADLIEKWCRFGGAECMASYGVDPAALKRASDADALAMVRAAVPAKHVAFIESFNDSCRFGDYVFVHAGIRPGIELDQQRQTDLRWIREPFLYDDTDHGFIVVHGHTISAEPEMLANRIGIDTGAYRSGVLTALAIDGTDTWLIDTRASAEASLSEK